MRRIICLLAVLAVCSAALAQNAQPSQTAPAQPKAPPVAPRPHPAAAMQRAGGSLLQATLNSSPEPMQPTLTNVSFFAVPDPQPRTLKKHDLITIIVREESETTSEGSTDLKKEAAIEARLEEWIKLSLKNLEIQGGAIGPIPPSVKANASRDFKGEATVERTDSMTLRVTGEVIDVKPNNTLVIQARQRIKTDDEEQTFILSGICRVQDITADNTILSTQMFDKDLVKTHKGAVRDTTQRGLIPKLLDALNPF